MLSLHDALPVCAKAVGFRGAAGVDVRVDERREPPRCLDDVVELESDLPEHVEVRPKPCGVDDEIRRVRDHLAASMTHQLDGAFGPARSEEHTSELQSLMRISYAVFCLKKQNTYTTHS